MTYKTKIKKNKHYKKTRKLTYGGKLQEKPTLLSNINSAVDLATSAANVAVASGIEHIAEKVDIDPNKSANENLTQITEKIKDVVDVLNSPKGEEFKQEVSEFAEQVVDILNPSIKKAENIIADGAKKLTETGTSIAITALNEIPPIFALSELSKAATAGIQAGETIAELTSTGAETLKNLGEQKKKADNIIEKGKNLFTTIVNKGNEYVSNTIQDAKNIVDSYKPNMINPNINPTITNPNKAFKQLHKEAKMVGGRLNKSVSEFLSPYKKTKRKQHKDNLKSRKLTY